MSDRIENDRTFLFTERQLQPHRFQGQQDIRKNDGRIQVKAFDGLERHLRGQVRGLTDVENTVLRPNPLIFGHVATGLSHKPDRRSINGFPAAGFQKPIIDHKGRNCTDGKKRLSMKETRRPERGCRLSRLEPLLIGGFCFRGRLNGSTGIGFPDLFALLVMA